MSATVSTRGGFGAYTVMVDNRAEGHVKESKRDGRFVAIRMGRVLGRFDSRVQAVDAVAREAIEF